MESKKVANNRIIDVVRLQRMMKKWKKLAVAPKSNSKGIKFLKRTLSLSSSTSTTTSSSSSSSSALDGGGASNIVPKGCLAVCVGEEMRRFVIPMEYLSCGAFGALLREAEEEFGFEQEGVLRIPCEVPVFESVLRMVEKNKEGFCCCSNEYEFSLPLQSQEPMCR